MKNFLKNQSIFALLYVIFGLILLIRPMTVGTVISYVVGICALLFGAVRIFTFWQQKEEVGYFKIELLAGVAFLVAGICILARPDILLSIFPLMLGILIIVDGAVTVNHALKLRIWPNNTWKAMLASGLLIILLGIVLIANPFGSALLMMRFLGAGLLIDGAVELWWFLNLSKKL